MPHCAVIIVAAGSSRRAGFDKLMAPLNGKPVLRRTLDAFLACPEVSEIILVTPPERFGAVMAAGAAPAIPVKRADGGTERHFSVSAGLDALDKQAEWVAVHDGARPLITPAQFSRCLSAAVEHGAAASASPIVDTLKRADANGFTGEAVSRDNLWAMETPQIFSLPLLRQAYTRVLEAGQLVTDEVSALEFIGHRTKLVSNDTPNPKITLPGDLAQVEKFYLI